MQAGMYVSFHLKQNYYFLFLSRNGMGRQMFNRTPNQILRKHAQNFSSKYRDSQADRQMCLC
jgi:hypothetical protein